MTEDSTEQQKSTVRPEDIRAKDIGRRSFVQRFGLAVGALGATSSLTGCGNESDNCDADFGDILVGADSDPTDVPTGGDSDVGDACDSD